MGKAVALVVIGLVAVGLVGCGSSSKQAPTKPPPTTPTGPVAPVVVPAAPDEPRMVFAKSVFAALGGGETETLVKLADPLDFQSKAGECKRAKKTGLNVDPDQAAVSTARERFSRVTGKMKGLKIDVLAIANKLDDADREHSRIVKKGGEISETCVAKTDVLYHDMDVKIRVQRDKNPPVEQQATIEALKVDDRWYLVDVPRSLKEKDMKDAMKGVIAKMDEFSKKMCACKDKACAEKVQDELAEWGNTISKDLADEKPDPDAQKEAEKIMSKYVDCMMKAMGS